MTDTNTDVNVKPAKVDELAGKRIIMTVGLPYSGKSQWARDMSKASGFPIVCPDAVRVAVHGLRFVGKMEPIVWEYVYVMAEALLRSGHDGIIVDATSIRRELRQRWRDRFPTIRIEYSQRLVDPETCIERAIVAGDTEIIPVIERMARQYEPVGNDE